MLKESANSYHVDKKAYTWVCLAYEEFLKLLEIIC